MKDDCAGGRREGHCASCGIPSADFSTRPIIVSGGCLASSSLAVEEQACRICAEAASIPPTNLVDIYRSMKGWLAVERNLLADLRGPTEAGHSLSLLAVVAACASRTVST